MKYILASMSIAILVATGFAGGCAKDNATKAANAAPKESAASTLIIPDGTHLVALLETHISTDTSQTGDSFVARTTAPLLVDGKTAIPTGATLRGVLGDVVASGRVAGRARMTLQYQSIVDGQGQAHAISAVPLSLQAASTAQGDVQKIVAGTALGAITGGIVAGGKGAAIGAGAGAGAGTILVLATKGEDLELNPGQRLSVHLTGPVTVKAATGR